MLIFPFKTTIGGLRQAAVLLFTGTRPLDLQDIQQAYQAWTERNVPPAHTFLVASRAQLDAMLVSHQPYNGTVPGLDRLEAWGTLHLCGFDMQGVVSRIDVNGQTAASYSGTDVTSTIEAAIAQFVGQRASDGDVVVPAPGGFYFEKLSGRYSSHFMRCEALLQSTLHIELLALALLPQFSKWLAATDRQRSHETMIYIDTMSIWPLAEKLSQLSGPLVEADDCYRIESFQSYEGLKDWNPVPGPAFAILSASTSGSLADAILARLKQSVSHVVTVLSLEDLSGAEPNARHQDVMTVRFRIPRDLSGAAALDGLRPTFEPAVSPLPLGCEAIRLFGERFLAQNARPKLVRVARGSLDAKARTNLARWARANAVIAARKRQDGKSFWSVSFDLAQLHQAYAEGEDSVLKAWLRNYAPPGEVAIIYPSAYGSEAPSVTGAAKALADKVQSLMRESRPGAEIPVLASQELNSSACQEKHALDRRGVIVVAPVIAGGFAFKQISAQLRRLQPKGPRLFLSFVALTDTLAQFKILENDLTLNEDDSVYRFRCKEFYPIGRLGVAAQWEQDLAVLRELLESYSEPCKPVSDALMARLDALIGGEGLPPTHTFLPTLRGAPLNLTTGFAMWVGSETISGEDKGAAVLLTIAALLEAARDARTTGNGETALKTGLFQQALIDPEMFTRYNDGVIQAALLRAAYPAELNYAMSRQASADMTNLLVKWFELAGEPAGEATAEFLFALYTGKLRLQPDNLQQVLSATSALPGWLHALGTMVRERLALT